MIRVMMLAPVLVIMSFALAKRKSAETGSTSGKSKITIPWFAFGFIGIICLNSFLQYILGVESVKEIPLNGAIEYIDTFMLTMAMTALGTDTSIEKFKQAGAKPFLLAGCSSKRAPNRSFLPDYYMYGWWEADTCSRNGWFRH